MTTSESLDVGWPVPSNLKIEKEHNLAAVIAKFSWDAIKNDESPFHLPADPSGGTFVTIVYRVLLNNNTYLAPNPFFSIGLPPDPLCSKSCVKVQAIYDLSSSVNILSEWSEEICATNPPDLYCQRRGNNLSIAKTQNNVSSRMRYAAAIKSARAAASYSGSYC